MTQGEAAQIAQLLNERNQLTVAYNADKVLETPEDYLFKDVDGQVVAAVELKRLQWYQGEVRHLSVHAAHEGKGYARSLFAEMERRAAARGCRILQCTIREGNKDSESFFAKAEFSPVSRFHNHVSGNNVAVWQKVLVPAV